MANVQIKTINLSDESSILMSSVIKLACKNDVLKFSEGKLFGGFKVTSELKFVGASGKTKTEISLKKKIKLA